MILAGDIGGTHGRLALFEVQAGQLVSIREATYHCQHHASLEDLVQHFLQEGPRPSRACFGIAGPVLDHRVSASNLPWTITYAGLAQAIGLAEVQLINDLEANAWGIPALAPQDLTTIHAGTPASGNQAVLSPGTGLGEAGLFWDGTTHHPFASEGGHGDFAPRDEQEQALLRFLQERYGHVSWERVISGPGLVNLYHFMLASQGGPSPDWLQEAMARSGKATAISQAALEGRCPICSAALDLMVSLIGSEAGNLALTLQARGGLFIGGGIGPKILPRLNSNLFREAFVRKGRLEGLLRQIPVRVITDSRTALLGAARYALRPA